MPVYEKENIKQKIDCVFAQAVYSKYQNKRYGVNSCTVKDEKYIEDLTLTRDVFEYYYNTQPYSFLQTASVVPKDKDCCNCVITDLIEKINRL